MILKSKTWIADDNAGTLVCELTHMKKGHRKFHVGDRVKIVKIPGNLSDHAGIGTPEVFERALGKIFRIEGFGPYGHVELIVSRRDTIWIEPEFVVPVENSQGTK